MKSSQLMLAEKYRIEKKIGETLFYNTFIAYDSEDCRVAYKILKRNNVSRRIDDIIRFHNELTGIARIDHPNIEKIFDVFEQDNENHIVSEYADGENLAFIIRSGNPFSRDACIDIVMQIAAALDIAHNEKIYHRSITPNSVVLRDYYTGSGISVKLNDFGIARIRDLSSISATDDFTNIFCYMSPEECGVISRPVSASSDLYSLGILFYRLLTGQLPFEGNSITSIIHQQIAKAPAIPSSINPSIPWILDSVIIKLLSKDPVRRYQSAKGLIRDLERIRNGEKDFLLGFGDKVIDLNFKTNLLGKNSEFQTLKNAAADLRKPNGFLSFIIGESGQGKTRLLEELKSYLFSRNLIFLSAGCHSYVNKIPFGPVKDLLSQYCAIFIKYDDDLKQRIRRLLKKKLGELGKVLINFFPLLEVVLGEYPEPVALEHEKEMERFLNTVTVFFYTLAKIENRLIIGIDDLQWADQGTIDVILSLIQDIDSYPLVIAGTYMDSDISEDHGITSIIQETLAQNIPNLKIHCRNFTPVETAEFISTLLNEKSEDIDAVAGFIHGKSLGNPFFSIEILKHLLNHTVIHYTGEKWDVDRDALRNTEIPRTALNLILKHISFFSEKEQTVLSCAAALRKDFGIDFLFLLFPDEKEEIVRVIDRAINLHIIEIVPFEKKKLAFIHYKIKDVFYQNLEEEERRELHRKIARTIEQLRAEECVPDTSDSGCQEMLFDLAYHYIETGDERKIIEYAVPAGKIAKENFAYNEALYYLNRVLEILQKDESSQKPLLNRISGMIAEIYLMTGQYDDSIGHFNRILPGFATSVEKAEIYRQISAAFFKKGDFIMCEEFGKKGLALLGERLPSGSLMVGFGIVKELIVHVFHNIFASYYARENRRKNSEADNKNKLIMLLLHTVNWSYILSNMLKFISSILRMLNITESRIGLSPQLCASIADYASLCMSIPLFRRSLHFQNKALELRRKIHDESGIAQSLQFIGFCYEWMGDYEKAISYFEQALHVFGKFGDMKESATTWLGIVTSRTYLSDYEEARKWQSQHSFYAKKTKDNYAISTNFQNVARIYFELGKYENAEKIGLKGHQLSMESSNWFILCCIDIGLSKVYMEKMELRKALSCIEEAKALNNKHIFIPHYVADLFPQYAEVCIMEYSMLDELSRKNRNKLIARIRKACMIALKKTRPWVTSYIWALRVYAKYLALTERNNLAARYFRKSIETGKKYKRKYEIARSYYEYGLFQIRKRRILDAKKNLEASYRIFDEISSEVYRSKVEKAIEFCETDYRAAAKIDNFMDKQRFSTIIKVSQDIGSILNLDELLQRVLKQAIEITGAQSGYLFIKNDDTEMLEIKATENVTADHVTAQVMELVNSTYKNEKAIILKSFMEEDESVLCVPLISQSEAIGVCYLDNKLSSEVFSDDDKDVLEVIMTQAAISIVNAKLYELATIDGLTKLYIHRHFQLILQNEIKRSYRYNHSCTLIMIDIDHFKNFNDTYGHQLGDEVLKNVSRIIRNNCRSTDIPARYGGEEFCIILPETDRFKAGILAEKIRKMVEGFTLIHEQKPLHITISLGIAEFPINALGKDELIQAADKAMYLSKKSGRNRVTILANP